MRRVTLSQGLYNKYFYISLKDFKLKIQVRNIRTLYLISKGFSTREMMNYIKCSERKIVKDIDEIRNNFGLTGHDRKNIGKLTLLSVKAIQLLQDYLDITERMFQELGSPSS